MPTTTATALHIYATCLVKLKHFEKAVMVFQKGLALNPGDVLARQGASPGSQEFQTAMHSAKKAVATRPTLGPARSVLAKLYLQAGQQSAPGDTVRGCIGRGRILKI